MPTTRLMAKYVIIFPAARVSEESFRQCINVSSNQWHSCNNIAVFVSLHLHLHSFCTCICRCISKGYDYAYVCFSSDRYRKSLSFPISGRLASICASHIISEGRRGSSDPNRGADILWSRFDDWFNFKKKLTHIIACWTTRRLGAVERNGRGSAFPKRDGGVTWSAFLCQY